MNTQRVLIADDQSLPRQVLARLLRKQGMEVCEAADGCSALAAFETCERTMEEEVRRGWWDERVFGAFTGMILDHGGAN